MRDALTEAFKLVAMDATIERVTVAANGPCFSAGGDLGEFGSAADLAVAHRIRQWRMPAQYLVRCAHLHTPFACMAPASVRASKCLRLPAASRQRPTPSFSSRRWPWA